MPANRWPINDEWNKGNPHYGKAILLLTPDELHALPPATRVVSISGKECAAADADDDTRFGYTAFGLLSNAEDLTPEDWAHE